RARRAAHRRVRVFFFFQAEDGIRDGHVTGVQTCALPIWDPHLRAGARRALPGVRARARRRPSRWDGAHRLQRGERSGGGAVPRGQDPVRSDRGDDRARARGAPLERRRVARDGARRGCGRGPPGAGGGVLLTLAALAVVLGPLIFVHEMGHFLAAKAVGIQVLRFSIGFGRPIFSWRRGETEYWLSWLPLG